ncbi:hypothetical protein H0H92_008266 [Tricholoma furcatifolium]|nr:hypothetical protein H0H92_008266 [Tricholoma furcatifolium]
MRRPTTTSLFSTPKPSLPAVLKATATAPVDSPSTAPGPCQSPPPLPSLKESRTVEHDRQRLKKAATFLKSKARKAHSQATQAQAQLPGEGDRWAAKHAQGAGARGVKTALLRVDSDRDDGEEYAVEENEVEWGAAAVPLRMGGPGPHADANVHKVEVPLADLLIARKPRHGRDRYPDFELVPAVRSVIVLDDASVVPEPDFEEPWEHVYASDAEEGRSPELTYAKIAALN